jgi:general secretion pathway protein J
VTTTRNAIAPIGSAGFTLIEMMVVMTLLALLALIMAGSIGFGSHVAAATTARTARLDQMWTAFATVRHQLAAAYPPTADADRFAGNAGAVAFVAPAPARLSLGGDEEVTLRIEGDPGAKQLVAEWRSLAAGQSEKPRRSILVGDLKSASFAYFGVRGDSPKQWQRDWTHAARLPLLVRFTGTFADGQALPDLVVALHLAENA